MQEPPTEEEQLRPFKGVLEDGKVRVADRDRFAELEEPGYGTREGHELVLRDYEALYLAYGKKMLLEDKSGKEVTFEGLAEIAQKNAMDSWTKFVIYRDLRSRGYIVREGFGFGTDLRVYERGTTRRRPRSTSSSRWTKG